ncbi:alpha/beta fold hydrolase [Wenzhouxiangella sp. AB-CW3]|uniref:alpha/beta fold hydrolase n=1 Tax=Wenzhouxiangella sp. AB-CW3 TaxID=2771012 RepID=UPI00168BC666|nr:alpha/beta fold hydrolase [Wenzhouxiangella sp. AB-CW3]QOC22628.1 alpha/beta fold hydrolase [Wenzhouxiangella sp. AB-CW3]
MYRFAALLFPLSLIFLAASPAATTPDDFVMVPAEMVSDEAPGLPARTDADYEWLRQAEYDTVVCPFRGRIDYGPGEVECGLIQVPENREVEGSRTIELHFVRINARGEDHEGNEVEVRDDPALYLTGGPGVKVEGYVARLKDHRITARRDLYILEQRGIGHSGDFCPFFADRNRADFIRPDFVDSQRAALEQTRACIEGAKARGVDVTGYHTFENARDIKALRLALGLDDWNVWGISYGSVLGQAYMKVDPDGIRAAVIDAIVPLDLHDLMRIPHWHDRNLDMLFDACEDQAACARAFGDLRERYMAAIEAMSEEPVALEVEADERYPTGKAYLFQDLIAGLPFSLLYEQSTHPAIPAIIEGLTRAAERRDQRFFRAIALMEQPGGPGMSRGMSTAVRCLDGYVDRWAEAAPSDFRDYPTLAHAFGALEAIAEAPEVCRQVGLTPRDTAQFELVETDLPVLVVNGAWDPITPVPLAEYIMPGFANGELVVFPHAGHGPTRSVECAGDLLNDYFDDPAAELDRECIEHGEDAADYIAPYFRSRAVTRGIVMHAEKEDRLRGHAVWGGLSAALSLATLIVLSFGWLARRLEGRGLTPAGGSRFLMFLASAVALTHLGGLGAAIHATSEITEAMLLFGMVSWARWFAWLGPLAGLLGILALVQAWRYRPALAAAPRIGLLLAGLAIISLSVFTLFWDLWPI